MGVSEGFASNWCLWVGGDLLSVSWIVGNCVILRVLEFCIFGENCRVCVVYRLL